MGEFLLPMSFATFKHLSEDGLISIVTGPFGVRIFNRKKKQRDRELEKFAIERGWL